MNRPSSPNASTAAHHPSATPHALLVLPPWRPRRLDNLRILVLADGNRRSSPRGGYASGAERVVSTAEHLAGRPDVSVMIACILSPDNIAKRSDEFFLELYKEFVGLGVAIATRGALVDAKIRMEVWGDLSSLRARGGHGAMLADAIEAVAAMTASVEDAHLRLILGVGYGPDTALELDVDVILRTGMEEPGVLRLSGLRTREGITNRAITTLWPDVEPHEVDEVIETCKRRAGPRFADGHALSQIVDLVRGLAHADIDAQLHVTILCAASRADVAAALDTLFAGPLRGCSTIAVEHPGDERGAPARRGAAEGARHLVRVLCSPYRGPTIEGELASVLAPGQSQSCFTLPDWLPRGSANVHACADTMEGVLLGIHEALRFADTHPPLLGGDRVVLPPVAHAISSAQGRSRASERDEIGSRFAGKALRWAASAGLLLPDPAWRQAAENYALTAFFIHFRVPTEWDRTGASWEERAELTARYMILVAAGDEGIFDRIVDGETEEQRWARLEASCGFLREGLRESARAHPPRVAGAELLVAIASGWRELMRPYRRSCLPAAAESFRAGLDGLYAASVAEHRPSMSTRLRTKNRDVRASPEAIDRRVAAIPPLIATRARSLFANALKGDSADLDELSVLLHLGEVASAIGAGLLFRTAALSAPAAFVTNESIHVLEEAAALLDYHVRLTNDLSGFLESPEGDRDPKENACTLLVPHTASGSARIAAVIRALATCRSIVDWLGRGVFAAIDRVEATWPSMGALMRRGEFVGRRVYEAGHYTTTSRGRMRAIFDAWERARDTRGSAPKSAVREGGSR